MTKDRPPLVRAMLRLEKTSELDPVVRAVEPLAGRLISSPARRRVLHGHQLGHALHPILTDLPLGMWVSSAVLDMTGGRDARPSAARLVGLGVLVAVPTAVTGWAEWAVAGKATKRVGVVHAAANGLSVAMYAGSWLARRRGHHGLGLALSAVGGIGLGVGGELGGHMALARDVATRDRAFGRSR